MRRKLFYDREAVSQHLGRPLSRFEYPRWCFGRVVALPYLVGRRVVAHVLLRRRLADRVARTLAKTDG